MIQLDTTDERVNELTGTYHYYPFGMEWEGGRYRKHPTNPPPTQGNFFYSQDVQSRYLYNGKEYVEEFDLGLYDYGARWYDPSIGRFMRVDPLAEKYGAWSPYAYVFDNPLKFTDPTGMWPWPTIQDLKNVAASTTAYVAGVGNALASNATGGFPGTRGNPNDFGSHAQAASYGQSTGDVISVVIGSVVSVAATITEGGEVLLAPETGGATALAIPETEAVAVYSGAVAMSGMKNLLSGDGVVKMNENNENLPYKEKMNKGAGQNRSGNNQVQNKQANQLFKKYGISEKNQDRIHREIKKLDLDYKGLEKHIKENYIDK